MRGRRGSDRTSGGAPRRAPVVTALAVAAAARLIGATLALALPVSVCAWPVVTVENGRTEPLCGVVVSSHHGGVVHVGRVEPGRRSSRRLRMDIDGDELGVLLAACGKSPTREHHEVSVLPIPGQRERVRVEAGVTDAVDDFMSLREHWASLGVGWWELDP